MRVVKELKELLPILLTAGYSPDDEGDWNNGKSHHVMTAHMLTQCGKVPGDAMEYAPEWLEERIEYPCIMQATDGLEMIYATSNEDAVVIERKPDSGYALGDVLDPTDMSEFELYANITKIGEVNAKENN